MYQEKFPIDHIKVPPTLLRPIERDLSFTELRENIRQHGVLVPIIITKTVNEFFLVAGYRRLTASIELDLNTIPALIVDTDAQSALVLSITENVIRKDLTPLQEGLAYYALETIHRLNRAGIAHLIGKSQSYVTQRIQILAWPQILKDALEQNILTFSTARELSDIKDIEYLRRVIIDAEEFGLSARKANFVTNEWKKAVAQQKPLEPGDIPHFEPSVYMEKCSLCGKDTPPVQFTIIRLCPKCASPAKEQPNPDG